MLAVLGALFANGLIAILELVAAVITGSSGMMAEALHSIADTTNQVFLLLGLRFYNRPGSAKHPFGYGKERFFWSFFAAFERPNCEDGYLRRLGGTARNNYRRGRDLLNRASHRTGRWRLLGRNGVDHDRPGFVGGSVCTRAQLARAVVG